MSQGDTEIQDSGADGRPQTFGQAQMGDSQRSRRLVPRTPDVQTQFNAICMCIYCTYLTPVVQC